MQQELDSVLESLNKITARTIPDNDYQQQIDRWNEYMICLDEIEEACNKLQYKGTNRTVQITVLKRNVTRAQTEKALGFQIKPELIVHTDAYLMQNMRNYTEQYHEPRVTLPTLQIFISIKWLERESLKLVMNQLSSIKLSSGLR